MKLKLKLKFKFKLFFSLLLIILLIILYYSSGYFFVFNNDAYIDADWVKVASEVSGRVDQVLVKDNALVKKNDVLLGVIQDPFLIAVNSAKANLEKAQAAVLVLNQTIDAARQQIKINQDNLNLANQELARYQDLVKSDFVSKQVYDQKVSAQQVASATLVQSQNLARSLKAELAQDLANIDIAQSALDQANYNLKHSVIYAPFDGLVNNLKTYPGDFINQGQVLFSLININTWRVVANIKESNLMGLKPGQKVYLYLPNSPWHLYPGQVESIGGGVAREPGNNSPNTGMPYVDPVTDWIRYDYKIPVRINFINKPKDLNLYLGTDVKVFIFL